MKFNKLLILPAVAMTLSLASCHNPVYEDEGDCEVHYRIRFVYDMNLKWADAFPSEVKSVNLYVFDQDGIFVREYTGKGEELSKPGYYMELDLEPGNYKMVAWCGLDNDTADESFSVITPIAGQTEIEQLTCWLNTKSDNQYPLYSDTRLYFMYHGDMEVDLPDSQNGETYYYTMPLVKDTNHVRVILQQLSGENMVPSDFDFRIDAADGKLAWDNSILDDAVVTYLPWDKLTGTAGVGKDDDIDNTRSLVYVDGVIADMTMSRLMADQKSDVMLTITNANSGKQIASVPVIQYALLSKKYYEEAYGHVMTDQEFLDREDEYVLTFFLDENMNWISSVIMIQSWRIVLHNYDLE